MSKKEQVHKLGEISPTPWTVEYKKFSGWSLNADDGYSMFSICYDEELGRPEEDAANAQLVSAAPDMLEAIEIFIKQVEEHGGDYLPGHLKLFMAARNKARGL